MSHRLIPFRSSFFLCRSEIRGVSSDRSNVTSGLTEAQRGRLAVWINDLEPSRAQVGDVMLWCLEHADAAPDVVEMIVKSLKRPEGKAVDAEDTDDSKNEFVVKPATSVPAVVARLFLTSDILYNSGAKVPNASFYRKWLVFYFQLSNPQGLPISTPPLFLQF